mgnify:CR=1 FL=1
MAKVYLFRNPLTGKIVERASAEPVSDVISNVRLEFVGEKEAETMTNKEAQKLVDKGDAVIPKEAVFTKAKRKKALGG